MFQLKFISLMFLISISLLVISFPLSAANDKKNYEQSNQTQDREHTENQKEKETLQQGQSSGNTSQQKSNQQSDYDSYKESDNKVDDHNTRDHTDVMH